MYVYVYTCIYLVYVFSVYITDTHRHTHRHAHARHPHQLELRLRARPDEKLRANSPTVHKLSLCCPQCVVMMQPPNVHSSHDKAAKDTFCRTIVSHTLKKYSTRLVAIWRGRVSRAALLRAPSPSPTSLESGTRDTQSRVRHDCTVTAGV